MRENPELFRPENTKNYKFSQASTSSLLQALKAEHTNVNQNQDVYQRDGFRTKVDVEGSPKNLFDCVNEYILAPTENEKICSHRK